MEKLKIYFSKMEFSWDKYINESFKAERHDLKNKIPSLFDENDFTEEEKKYAKRFKQEYLHKLEEAILDNMKKLPNIVTYELQDVNLKETLKAITMDELAVPLGFRNGNADVNFVETDISSIETKDNEFCKINQHRLSSIVYNVLENANQQCSRKQDDAILNNKNYESRIWMNIKRITKDSNDYISVSITDNAGGFPDDVIDEVYKSPVKSSKKENGKERTGEGTVYVGFFAKYMNIKIEAENCIAEDNNKGAKVTLFIPIYATQSNKKEEEKI